jgi:hypothetical protein
MEGNAQTLIYQLIEHNKTVVNEMIEMEGGTIQETHYKTSK